MLSEDRQLDKLIAEKVFGYEVEMVKPDWYPFEVYLFKWPERGVYAYSLDEDACNARMYRNGVDEREGFLDSLPFYSSAEFTDFVSIHEPMMKRFEAEIYYSCQWRGYRPIYSVQIKQPWLLSKSCRGDESEDMAWALCSAVKRFFEIAEGEGK
jgi:hypothetical protein